MDHEYREAVEVQRQQLRKMLKDNTLCGAEKFDVFCETFKFETFNSGMVIGGIGATVVLMLIWWLTGAIH